MMIALRRTWWAALVLAAFVGCGTEEPATDVTPPADAPADAGAPGDAPAPAETVPPPTTPPAGEMPAPTPEAKTETKDAPAETPPAAEEGLKLEPPVVTPPSAEKGAEPAKDQAAADTLSKDELVELASLSADDKALALKQIACPVSGEHLGSMGAPIKVSAEGKSFFICCKGCNEEVKEKPKEVVAKLKK